MCIFVPAGHLNAGTAADTSREVGSMEELIFYEVKKRLRGGNDLRKRLSSVKGVSGRADEVIAGKDSRHSSGE
jgi:hypothetical protein